MRAWVGAAALCAALVAACSGAPAGPAGGAPDAGADAPVPPDGFPDPLDATSDGAPPSDAGPDGGLPFRYASLNVGNVSPGCWEGKLCSPQVAASVRAYLATYRPDVVLLSEVYEARQLLGTAQGGPILPPGYAGRCGESRDRTTGALAAFDAAGASHEHECVGWRTDRLAYVDGSAASAYGRDDAYGRSRCNYDFTGFRVRLALEGRVTVTVVAVHPDSRDASCRGEEIRRYFSELADGAAAFVAGDWNTEDLTEIAPPPAFAPHYEQGLHFGLAQHPDEWSAIYAAGVLKRKLDDAYGTVGTPCTSCGAFYGTEDLPFGSALGGYDGHPRADAGFGLDHRQLLVDVRLDR